MAFSQYEITPSLGAPVELFEFFFHNQYYRYAHYDENVTTPSEGVWTAARLSRSSFSRGLEIDRAGITITTDSDLEIVSIFDDGAPESIVELTVYRMHVTDPAREKWVVWAGQVTTRKRRGKEVQFICEVPEVSLRTLGLRRRYQRPCPYPLYGEGCNVSRVLHLVTSAIVAVTQAGAAVQVGVADCSPFSGGLMTAVVNGFEHQRHIAQGVGDTLNLVRPISWGSPGLQVSLYPGCDRTLSTCWNTFNNGLDFGGFEYMPEDNPFSSQVY